MNTHEDLKEEERKKFYYSCSTDGLSACSIDSGGAHASYITIGHVTLIATSSGPLLSHLYRLKVPKIQDDYYLT